MAERLEEEVRAAAKVVNPRIKMSCPLSKLAHGAPKLAPGTAQGDQMRSLVQRFVLYSKAPPAMMHVNHLVSCYNIPTTDHVGDKHPSQSPGNLDLDKFIEFFTPQPMGNTSEAKEEEVMFGEWRVDSTECDEHYLLRNALLEACERLGMQFGSLYPTPKELFLMQRLDLDRENTIVAANQDSLLDIIFTDVVKKALVSFERSDDKFSIKLMKFIVRGIDNASIQFSTKVSLAERLIFSLMPHPWASAGSRLLMECFHKAICCISKHKHVNETLAVEALVAATDRLGTSSEVKKLFKQVMRETVLIKWVVRPPAVEAINMRQKFKSPKVSSNSKIPATKTKGEKNTSAKIPATKDEKNTSAKIPATTKDEKNVPKIDSFN